MFNAYKCIHSLHCLRFHGEGATSLSTPDKSTTDTHIATYFTYGHTCMHIIIAILFNDAIAV